MNNIQIKCPKCKKEGTVGRCIDDPDEAVRVFSDCPDCSDSGDILVKYEDADGNEVKRR